MDKARILIVEDERLVAQDIKLTLERMGYEALSPAATGKDALRSATQDQPALVLMDIHLAGKMDGITAAKKIITKHDIPVIYLTAYADEETLARVKETSPYGYITKPFDETNLRITIEIAIHKHATENARRASELKFRHLVEHSHDGIMLTDESGKIIEWNTAQEKISGIPRDEAIEQSLLQVMKEVALPKRITKKRIAQIEKFLIPLFKYGKGEWFEHQHQVQFRHRDGSVRTGQVFTFPIPTEKGYQIGGFTRDITNQKAAEEALRTSEERYRSLYTTMSEGQAIHELVYDEQGKPIDYRFIDVNPAYERIVGYKKEDVLGKFGTKVYGTETAPYLDIYAKVALNGKSIHFETYFAPLNIVFDVTAFSPKKGQFATLFSDITGRKQAEEANEQYRAELRTLMLISQHLNELTTFKDTVQAILDAIIKHTFSSAGSIFITDSSSMQAEGFHQGLSEKTIRELKEYCPLYTNVKWHQCIMQQKTAMQRSPNNGGINHCPPIKDAGIKTFLSIPIKESDALIGYLHLYRRENIPYTEENITFIKTLLQQSISAIKKALLFEKTQHLSITDPLTQLYNRRHLYTLGKRELERAQRYQQNLSALMIDVDHFKKINDTYGHATGDKVLQRLANQLRRQTRDVDILGRYGGEEFVIILPSTPLSAATELAERLRVCVNREVTLSLLRNHPELTISIGVASLGDDTPNLESLLDKADTALYQAKRKGRNTVVAI